MAKGFSLAKYAESLEKSAPAERDVETITAEYLQHKKNGGKAILGMGNCLIEIKARLSHGEWLTWLEERADCTERAAQRLMKLAREFSNPTALSDLGATKALSLLVLPPDEREAFMAEPHLVNGQEKSVASMTSRELEQVIRERDEARKELKKLRDKPVDVAVEVDREAVERARAEAVAEMEERVRLAEVARREAEKALEEARRKLEGAGLKDGWKDGSTRANWALLDRIVSQTRDSLEQLGGMKSEAHGKGEEQLESGVLRALRYLSDYAQKCAE